MANHDLLEHIQARLRVGRERYGHGVLVLSNADKDWRNELAEELLDAVVYAAADVLTKRGVVDDDANEAIATLIAERMTSEYEFQRTVDTEILDLCLFVARAVCLRQKNSACM